MDGQINWRAFIAEMGPALFRYFSMSFEASQADDLVQETFIRLLSKIRDNKFDPSRGHLRMYAYGIAHFIRVEHRRSKRFEPLPEIVSSQSFEEGVMQSQALKALRSAITELSEDQQQVLGLYLDSELSLENIGVVLDMPAATVRSHLHRAKSALTEKLNQKRGVKNE
jgi:RNA polymerase sigma-70 factor (ECF subfamily)